jgi:serine/threonine protein phosphatase PrpC
MSGHEALALSSINCVTSGTTCILVYMIKDKLYVSNVGDSRAVMGVCHAGDGGEEVFVSMDLSKDHKPDR